MDRNLLTFVGIAARNMLAESSSKLVVESHHLVIIQCDLFFIDTIDILFIIALL